MSGSDGEAALLPFHQVPGLDFALPSGMWTRVAPQNAPQISKKMDFVHLMTRFRSVIQRIERLYQGDNIDNELSECVERDTYDTNTEQHSDRPPHERLPEFRMEQLESVFDFFEIQEPF
ncbi:hypothetical protein GOP47_0024454 [Adiantum capillus-veneris]|uniref:Uncharacterized protein n=1 Tax=Adiantum capillus-veneris TaxID=13818 RepID=A0A9D4U1X0_ADICA|nr:hypothetical protein GOP47_0024454 [Adiantum capillus-veneris]